MAIVGSAEVVVSPSFTGFQSKVNGAATKLESTLASAGKEGGDKAGDNAAKEIEGSLKKANSKLSGSTKEATAAGGNAAKGYAGGFGKGLKSMAKAVAGPIAALFALDAIKGFATGAYEEAREAQKVGAQTAAVIKSTGGAAKVTAKQVGDLAGAISAKTGIDDETIQSGANMLLTFKNLRNETGKGNDMFNQATHVLTDMSTAMGTEPKQAAIQLGKALNDPIKGTAALGRVGVQFTEKQKKAIEKLQESGNIMGAQKIILKELNGQFKGSAEAQATAGEKATNAWNNFKEEIGTKALPIVDKFFTFIADTGLPAVMTMIDGVIAGVSWFNKWKDTIAAVAAPFAVATAALVVFNFQQKVSTAGGFIKWLQTLSVVTKAQAAVQWVLNAAMSANPIGIVVVAIAALVAGLVLAYKKSETFRKIVNGAWSAIKTGALAVWNWFKDKFLPFFTETIPNGAKKLLGWFKKNWPLILGILTGPIGLAVVAVVKNWDKITGAFKKGKDWVVNKFKKAWQATKKVVTAPIDAAKEGVSKAWDKTTGAFNSAKKWVSGTWKKGWDKAKGWIGSAVEKGRDAAGVALGLKKGVQSKFDGAKKWVSGTWKKGWSKAKGWIADSVDDGRKAVGKTLGSGGTLRTAFTKVRDWGKGTWKKSWAGMEAVLKDPVGEGRKAITKAFSKDGVRKAFNGFDEFGRKVFGKKWAKMKDVLSGPAKGALQIFRNLFGYKGKVRTVFNGFVEAARNIFGKVKSVIVKPIKEAIGVVNRGLIKGGINWILKKLKVPANNLVPWIPTPKLATGGGVGPAWRKQVGKIRGPGGPREDKVPLLGSAGEHMWSAREVAKAGGHKAMESLRQAARNGKLRIQALAGGGPVQPVPGIPNRHSGYPWATWAGDYPSGYGGTPPVRAWKDGVVAAIQHLTTSYGNHVRMNHDDGTSSLYAHLSRIMVGVGARLKAGQIFANAGWSGNVHPPGPAGAHLHFETMGGPYNGGSGGGGGVVDKITDVFSFLKGLSPTKFLSNLASKLVGKLPGDAGGLFGRGLTRIPSLVIGKAGEWIKDKINPFGSSTWSGAGVGNWNRDQLNNAASIISTARGTMGGNWSRAAVIGLMTAMQESTLRNLNWGDRDSVGLFQQRAPWGSFADRTNPAKSAWMFYNGGQGGQPGLKDKNWLSMGLGQAAQAVQVSQFPGAYSKWEGQARQLVQSFDTGGRLPKGLSLVHNGTGREELVLNPAQERARLGGYSGGEGTIEEVHLHVHLEGGMVDDRTADRIAEALERRKRRRGGVTLRRKS